MSLIGKQVGSYLIKAKLGEGGMGTVYLGEHPTIGKRVAVKVLLEELAAKEEIVTRFFNEAKAVNDIGHQNIVDVFDLGKMKSDVGADIVYFIMEFLDGESLAQRIRTTGLAFNETIHVIQQCCAALAASHAKGIVHRDLKPENIYLCPRGADKNFVKILDFGIAKLTGDGGTSSHKTRTGLVIGTPTYMSPEQCEGKGLIDSRSDVYSLGVVMYELLTGRVPFPGEGFGEILVAHLTKEPDPPSSLNPDISPELEAIVMHAIEKDRNRRFQTMDEFGAAIADLGAHMAAYKQLPAFAAPATGTGSAATQMGPRTSTGARPTTLSGSAAEVSYEPAKKSRAPLFIGVIVLAVIGAGATYALTAKKPPVAAVQPVQPVAPVVPPPAAPPKDESVKLRITSDPAGVDVVRAGTVLGPTPLDIDAKKGDPSFEIELRKAGFVSQKKLIEPTMSRELSFALAAEPAVAATAVAKKTPRSSGRKTSGDGKPTKSNRDDDMSLMQPNWR